MLILKSLQKIYLTISILAHYFSWGIGHQQQSVRDLCLGPFVGKGDKGWPFMLIFLHSFEVASKIPHLGMLLSFFNSKMVGNLSSLVCIYFSRRSS